MKAKMFLVAFATLRGCAGDDQKGKACPSTTVELNTGACMPMINLGGYNHSRPSNRTLWLEVGGRAFDTCSYISPDEQKAVGDAVAASSIPRSDIFITTKVPCCPNPLWGCEPIYPWAGMNASEAVRKAASWSMELLGMTYVDLILLGTPCDTMEDTVAAYRALEELSASGKTRAIGISNFNKPLINALMKEVTVVPAVNQCEYFVGHHSERKVLGNDPETLKQCQDLGITFSGYSVFGWPDPVVLHDPDVKAVAAAHNKSAAEIALRWVVQQGVVAVTSSNKESHDKSDLGVFNFSLTQDEMARLNNDKGEAGSVFV
jgi:2,5-diketo-D-gluconate reductase A